MIGTSGPVSAGEIGAQRPDTASSIGIERGRAVCELDEIMQILPGSSDNAHAYKCITGDLQYDNRVSLEDSNDRSPDERSDIRDNSPISLRLARSFQAAPQNLVHRGWHRQPNRLATSPPPRSDEKTSTANRVRAAHDRA